HSLYVYPRISASPVVNQFSEHPKIHRIAAPIVQISATFIRKAIENKEDVRAMLPDNVWQYIDEMNFYR
ncbi:MAG: nicotinic acid mononucleotide adenylyltransferase, partial [Lutibacter sp.]|nr:nicotinic acid mononucleotide adenylyltransferase [Lutibacter sp.]